MNRSDYYRQMIEVAGQQRELFNITGARVLKSDLRRVFKHHGVQVDLWPMPGMLPRKSLKNLRGAYINHTECGPCVMISRNLPDEPQIFTMAHELKHHLADKESMSAYCHASNESDVVEIGAEVFAAEFIYPQQLFIGDMAKLGVARGECEPRHIVDLKRNSQTTLPYIGLAKRAIFLGYCSSDSLKGVRWKKLEESLYGEPDYKRIVRYRRARLVAVTR